MAWPLLIGVASAIGSAIYLWQDWRTARDIEDSVSQMEAYLRLLEGQMTLTEFLEAAWPSLALLGAVLVLGYIIATPRRARA